MVKHHILTLMQGIDHRKWSGMSSFIEFTALYERASDLLSHNNSCSQPCLLLPYIHLTVYCFWSLNLCLHFPLSIYPCLKFCCFSWIYKSYQSVKPSKSSISLKKSSSSYCSYKIIQLLRALVLRFPIVSLFSVSSKFSWQIISCKEQTSTLIHLWNPQHSSPRYICSKFMINICLFFNLSIGAIAEL